MAGYGKSTRTGGRRLRRAGTGGGVGGVGVKFLMLRRAAQRLQLTAHFPSSTSMEMRTYKTAAHCEETTSLNEDELSTKQSRKIITEYR